MKSEAAWGLAFHVSYPDGKKEELGVESGRAMVGSGAHAEIRLPREHAAVEQLLVEVRNGAVYAEARSLEPPALLGGSPFTSGRILPESVLEVGGVQLRVLLSQCERAAGTAQKRSERGNPVVYVLGLVGIPFGLFVSLAPVPEAEGIPSSVGAPALFAEAGAVQCRESARQAAAVLGDDQLALADAKRERSPFRPDDGVAAVEHYRVAAACLRVSGETELARSSLEQSERLARSLEREFHVHQVRLERALEAREFERALTEVRILSSFVSGQKGEYPAWLSTLDRHIELKYAGGAAREAGGT
jgi:hypothetical protein